MCVWENFCNGWFLKVKYFQTSWVKSSNLFVRSKKGVGFKVLKMFQGFLIIFFRMLEYKLSEAKKFWHRRSNFRYPYTLNLGFLRHNFRKSRDIVRKQTTPFFVLVPHLVECPGLPPVTFRHEVLAPREPKLFVSCSFFCLLSKFRWTIITPFSHLAQAASTNLFAKCCFVLVYWAVMPCCDRRCRKTFSMWQLHGRPFRNHRGEGGWCLGPFHVIKGALAQGGVQSAKLRFGHFGHHGS